METAHCDFETRSAVDLRKAGVHRYFEDASTDVHCMAWAIGDGDVQLWTPDMPFPAPLAQHIKDGGALHAWNAAFERACWGGLMTPSYKWPEVPVEQWRCSMAQALAMALPGGLDDAALALGVKERKDVEGSRLMMQMSKPRAAGGWWEDDERKQRLYAYCKQDVVVEREVGRLLVPLRPAEQRLWQLDQRINDRGVQVDVELCNAAKRIVSDTKALLDRRMSRLTGGAVKSCSNVADIVAFLAKSGIVTESIDKNAIEDLLTRKLSEGVRKVLLLRKQAARASVSKIDALLAGMNKDGRARGLLQYHAASTGRWGGRRFQPQNLKRPDPDADIGALTELVRKGEYTLIEGDPLMAVSNVLRSMIKAGG